MKFQICSEVQKESLSPQIYFFFFSFFFLSEATLHFELFSQRLQNKTALSFTAEPSSPIQQPFTCKRGRLGSTLPPRLLISLPSSNWSLNLHVDHQAFQSRYQVLRPPHAFTSSLTETHMDDSLHRGTSGAAAA